MNYRYDELVSPTQDDINRSSAIIIAAYTRMLGEFPMLNRFIVNKNIYARNEFNVAMVVLKSGKTDFYLRRVLIPSSSSSQAFITVSRVQARFIRQ